MHYYQLTKVPGTTTCLLTDTEKMPCLSWDLPARKSCPFAVLGPNHICSKCYGFEKGHYARPSVKRAQMLRFDWTQECLRTKQGTDDWIDYMVQAILHDSETDYFRMHSDGDLFSPLYTRAWYHVCERIPEINFWVPSRSWQAPWVDELRLLNSLDNVNVRPSALEFDQDPPVIEGLAAGSGAKAVGYNCPAHENKNHCPSWCRKCFVDPEWTAFFRSR